MEKQGENKKKIGTNIIKEKKSSSILKIEKKENIRQKDPKKSSYS